MVHQKQVLKFEVLSLQKLNQEKISKMIAQQIRWKRLALRIQK